MKKVIYSVLLNDTDTLKEPYHYNTDWNYVCITDNPELKSDHWDIQLVPKSDNTKKASRFYKIKNQFPQYDLSVYIDATFEIRRDLNHYTHQRDKFIWVNKHPMRSCAYEEAQIVIDKKLDDKEVVENQLLKYQFDGFPGDFGLWRCGIIIRNPKDDKVENLCNIWYNEIEEGSWRDQISFPYACWKADIYPKMIPYGLSETYFKQSLHKASPTNDWKFVNLTKEESPDYDKSLIEKYPTAHLIVLKDGILFPRWVNNYISLKNGIERFCELVKILNGTIVRG